MKPALEKDPAAGGTAQVWDLKALTLPPEQIAAGMAAYAKRRALARMKRPPDFIIGGPGSPYLRRWWLIPRNRWFNIYLHNMLRDDDDRALHDHPWWNISIILKGGYDEHMPRFPREWPWNRDLATKRRRRGHVVFRRARAVHRLTLPAGAAESWSLFITGPVMRGWGFWCPQGWRFWRDFVDDRDTGSVGKGCE